MRLGDIPEIMIWLNLIYDSIILFDSFFSTQEALGIRSVKHFENIFLIQLMPFRFLALLQSLRDILGHLVTDDFRF